MQVLPTSPMHPVFLWDWLGLLWQSSYCRLSKLNKLHRSHIIKQQPTFIPSNLAVLKNSLVSDPFSNTYSNTIN
ncbi:hypothetical protein BDF19DRAFT_447218 [Syncephalis fuscata]|nr:hypothetical protein BDF19DRAFT_447218 [Syncephalis fuscata]